MSNVQVRFDYRKFEKATKTDAGFLKAPVYATRVGVFKYMKADGTILREYRPAEEVFRPDSMESLAGVPLTNRHPAGLLNSKNAKSHMVGYTSDKVDREDLFIKTLVTITDEDTIKDVELKGIREVSCGYTCELEMKSGTFDGEEYDAIQRNIKYNHLALVEKGRAGRDVRLKLDADSAILDNELEKQNDKGESMAKMKIGEAEFEVEAGVAQAIQTTLKEAKKDADDRVASKEKEVSEMKAKADAAQAKLDEATEEIKKLKEAKLDEAKIQELVAKRAKLLETAKPFLKADTDFSQMSELEIKKAVVLAKHPEVKLDDKSEVYVEARFDAILETKEEKKDDLKKTLSKVEESRKDSKDEKESAEAVRQRNMKADSEAWKKPIGSHLN